jgi:hypothetical protein
MSHDASKVSLPKCNHNSVRLFNACRPKPQGRQRSAAQRFPSDTSMTSSVGSCVKGRPTQGRAHDSGPMLLHVEREGSGSTCIASGGTVTTQRSAVIPSCLDRTGDLLSAMVSMQADCCSCVKLSVSDVDVMCMLRPVRVCRANRQAYAGWEAATWGVQMAMNINKGCEILTESEHCDEL